MVKASQKIMDQMDEGCSPTCTTQQQHATSPLTPEMESIMLNFYLSDLKLCTMQLAGFSKTVTENHNILDITDQDGRRCRYVGNRHKCQKQLVDFFLVVCAFSFSMMSVEKFTTG